MESYSNIVKHTSLYKEQSDKPFQSSEKPFKYKSTQKSLKIDKKENNNLKKAIKNSLEYS